MIAPLTYPSHRRLLNLTEGVWGVIYCYGVSSCPYKRFTSVQSSRGLIWIQVCLILEPLIPHGSSSYINIYFLKFIFNGRIISVKCCGGFAVQQQESAMSIHISPPSWAPSPPPLRLSSLWCWGVFPLVSCFTRGVVCIRQCCFLNSSHLLLPLLCLPVLFYLCSCPEKWY